MAELTERGDIERALRESPVVAVLGAHCESQRPACYVPAYLHQHGYRILPVNPTLAGTELWGQPVRALLADLDEPIDMVDVFRRSDHLHQHTADILAMQPLPRVVWLQLGIRNDEFARALVAAGIDVIQSRCTMADHRRFGLGAPGRPAP